MNWGDTMHYIGVMGYLAFFISKSPTRDLRIPIGAYANMRGFLENTGDGEYRAITWLKAPHHSGELLGGQGNLYI